jgi:DNA polymerase-3 subunit gamma/tau
MLKTAVAVAERNYDVLFDQIAEVVRSSKDLSVFWQDLISLYRDMLVVKTTKNAASYLDLTDHEREQMESVARLFKKETLLYHCTLLEDALLAMENSNAVKRIVAEMTLVRMCDEALDTSYEALLSRVARLEEQIVTGAVIRKSSEKKEPVAEKRETPAQTPSTPAAPAPKTAGASDKRILHPIRSWMEVVERITRSSPMEAGFVKNSRAYTTEDGAVIVRFDSDFSMQMMSKDDSRDRLRMAASSVLRREVGDRMLQMEVAGKTEAASVIDEIIDASEEI